MPIMQRIRAKAAELNIPLTAHLELTDRCNLFCRHCYVSDRDGNGELITDEWKHILDELAGAGTLQLALSGGEIFLREDLFDIVAYARKREFGVNLFTNATLIDDAAARRLKQLCVERIETSILGADAETHDGITKVPGSFDRMIAGVKRLRDAGVAVQMKTTWTKESIGQARALKALVKDLDASFRSASLLIQQRDGEWGHLDLKANEDALRRMYLDSFQEMKEAGFEPPSIEPEPVAPGRARLILPCSLGVSTCSVDARGHVHPCAGAYTMDLGSLVEKPFAEIWQHPALEKIRKIRLSDLEECAACRLWDYCNRCAALALTEKGSLKAASPQACACARAKYGLVYGKACEIQ